MDAAAPQRLPADICAFAILETFLTQEEIVLAHIYMHCLLLLIERTAEVLGSSCLYVFKQNTGQRLTLRCDLIFI